MVNVKIPETGRLILCPFKEKGVRRMDVDTAEDNLRCRHLSEGPGLRFGVFLRTIFLL